MIKMLAIGCGVMLLLGGVIMACSPRNSDPSQTINARHALMQEDVVVLDVRTRVEFASDHLEHAINIPVGELPGRVGELPEDLSTPIVVYCRSGGRSARARAILEENGYTDVTDGGAIKSLQSVPLPD